MPSTLQNPPTGAPVRDRGGAPFRWEADMIDPLLAARADFTDGLFAGGPADSFLEVPTVSGVPDVVFVEWDEAAIAERERRHLAPVLGLTQLRVLERLTACPTVLADLASATGVTPAHLRRSVLPALTAAGWLPAGRSPVISLVPGLAYRPPAAALVTVEAKLSNWRQAFTQGVGHVQSADQSFIALDARKARPVMQFVDDLAVEGVGVATVDASSGTVRIMSRPVTRRPRRAAFLLAAEQVWNLRRTGLRSGPTGHVFGRVLPSGPDAQTVRD